MGKFKAIDFYKVLNEEKLLKQALDNIRNGLPRDIFYASSSKWTTVLGEFYRLLENHLRDYDEESNKKTVEFEYFKIDAGIWEEEEVDSAIDTALNYLDLKKSKRNIWNFEVAIEHENDFADWLYELKQLLCFNVPLKVLISYNNKAFCVEEEFVKHLTNVLNTYAKFHKPKVGDEFVFLFGKTSAATSKQTNSAQCKIEGCNQDQCASNGLIQYKFISFSAQLDSSDEVSYILTDPINILSLEDDEAYEIFNKDKYI